jgi:ATP adenylyltransferase
MNCQYCEKGADLMAKMIPICTYRTADIYLFRDQTHKGKCIVACGRHVKEWYELSEAEQTDLIAAVSKTAKALQELFHPDKINYATYGDLLSHLHIHVTPKYQDGPDWGGPFRDDAPATVLSDDAYAERVEQLREKILSE